MKTHNTLRIFVVLLMVVSLNFNCSSGDTSGSTTIQPPSQQQIDPDISVLVSPSELKSWIDNGYPGDSYGNKKVVVLFIGDQTDYELGHIPGSHLVTPDEIKSNRSDGVSMTIDMVATKSQMDNIIQRTGIDKDTLVVLTGFSGESSFMNIARAYFNFRYWGFTRAKVRVLDGFVDTTWASAGYPFEFGQPANVKSSSYSVCNLQQYIDRFRAPLQEMIAVASDNDPATIIVDTRTNSEYSGSASQTSTGNTTYVSFEGHIRGSNWLEYKNILDPDGKLVDLPTLQNITNTLGLSDNTTAYLYSKTSWSAALMFLAVDGVLNYPVKLYDGGWIEWGQMSDYHGNLSTTSPWHTDTLLGDIPTAVVVDNLDPGFSITGIWNTSTSKGYGDFYGTDFRYIASGSGTNKATWTPALTTPGQYTVYIWHTAKAGYATNAEFIVNHAGGATTYRVDLTRNGGRWYELGTFTFNATGSENVTVTDNGNSFSFIVADAVAFVPSGAASWLSESVTYNNVDNVSTILANSNAPNANDVNTTDTSICNNKTN